MTAANEQDRTQVVQLTEQVQTVTGETVAVASETETARYPALVEQHVFRIVHQAVENTLNHAQANTLTIAGY
ncbi:MAG: hypothetical protein ACT4QE_17705 [Anaerolineales bacterium]